MKKIVKIQPKLNLNKETISNLHDPEVDNFVQKFGSSQNGGICVCVTTLLRCNTTDLGCDTKRNCPTPKPPGPSPI